MESIDFRDAIMLITGGAGGIGDAIVSKYLSAGAKVIVLDKMAADIYWENHYDEKLDYYSVDLLDNESIDKVFKTINEKYNKITHLVNNVGIYDNDAIHEIDISRFKKMIDINIMVSLEMFKRIIPAMKKEKYGRVINIASIAAFFNGVNAGTYNMTKAAVVSMTKTLAKEVKECGINVNAICPGLVDTNMLESMIGKRAVYCKVSVEDYTNNLLNVCEQKRLVKPEEVAGVALFLGSEYASGVSGAIIPVTANGLMI